MKDYVPLYKVKNLAFYKTEKNRKELLWCTNGVANGNTLLTDSAVYNGSIQILCRTNDGLYFSKAVKKDKVICELWWTDGTQKNTSCISSKFNCIFSGIINCILSENNDLLFVANTENFGSELWILNGNRTEISMIKDIRPGRGGSEISWLTSLEGIIYFTANDGKIGHELWRTDGTEKGTYCVKDICNESIAIKLEHKAPLVIKEIKDDVIIAEELKPVKNYDIYGPLWLTKFNNRLYFTANDGIHGRELWSSDGTSSGTRLEQEFIDGEYGGEPNDLCLDDKSFYLKAKGDRHGMVSLFSYDTNKNKFVPAKSVILISRNQFSQADYSCNDDRYIRVRGEIFFNKIYVEPPRYNGTILCKTDTTFQEVYTIKKIENPDTYPQLHKFLGEIDGIAYFSAKGEKYGELWQTDGTQEGTYKVWNSNYWQGAEPISLLQLNGKWVFVAFDDNGNSALWQLIPKL